MKKVSIITAAALLSVLIIFWTFANGQMGGMRSGGTMDTNTMDVNKIEPNKIDPNKMDPNRMDINSILKKMDKDLDDKANEMKERNEKDVNSDPPVGSLADSNKIEPNKMDPNKRDANSIIKERDKDLNDDANKMKGKKDKDVYSDRPGGPMADDPKPDPNDMMTGMHPMSGMMVNSSMVATSDGGVVILIGNKLVKYDKKLKLVRETEVRVDWESWRKMREEHREMMKNEKKMK